jgi:hypothetical protein
MRDAITLNEEFQECVSGGISESVPLQISWHLKTIQLRQRTKHTEFRKEMECILINLLHAGHTNEY